VPIHHAAPLVFQATAGSTRTRRRR
jgi:hypothetical protein